MSLAPSCVKACPFVSQRWANKKDSRAPVDTGDTMQQTSCIIVGVAGSQRLRAQLGTDERPTCEATADALRGSRCLGMSPRVVAGKSVVYSLFVNALSDLRQQRSSPRSRPAIGAMATICSMAGGSSPRGAFGASWKEDTAGDAWRQRRRPMMKLKNKKVIDNGD